MADYRVTIIFDYSVEPDDPKHEIDDDELHDAIMDSFDTVDLEGTYEATVFDENGDEVEGETTSVNYNCDNVREVNVEKLES